MARRAAPLPKVMLRCREAGRQANPATRRKYVHVGSSAASMPPKVAEFARRPALQTVPLIAVRAACLATTRDYSANPRNKSLTDVLLRVFSSTCLTITAQYSEWLPSAAGSEPDTTTLYGGTLP